MLLDRTRSLPRHKLALRLYDESQITVKCVTVSADQTMRDAAARDDAFLDRRAGRMHRVINAILAFLRLDLGGAAADQHARLRGKSAA
jgi:hypothetical protein